MNVLVFVSATNQDLHQDCRPYAIRAVQQNNAVAITMENWDAEFLDPVEVCRQKIEQESSHYLGIYAHRYGWVPVQLGKSITEAEFDWAINLRKPMVVFVPKPGTDFDIKLRERAAEQSQDEETAQKEFLRRVSTKGVIQLFDDAADLTGRVARKVILWTQGGLRGIARREHSSPTTSSPTINQLVPSEDQIIQLGRKDIQRDFEDSLERLAVTERSSNVAGFLIHGFSGYGHKEIAKRLRQTIEQKSIQPRYYSLDIGVLWRQNSLEKLLELIGSAIGTNETHNSPQLIAKGIQTVLEISDLVLEISGIQRFNGSLDGVIRDFWHPLVSTLESNTQYRLIVLLNLEWTNSSEREKILQSPLLSNTDLVLTPTHPVKLPELQEFTREELKFWLCGRLQPSEAAILVETLMEETNGKPELLYNKLRDNSTWVR